MTVVKHAAPITAAEGSTEGSDVVMVGSRLLGTIPVPRGELLAVPAGLFGFEACRSFALLPAGRDGLWWLQSVDREELVFLLADPFLFFPGHEVDVPPAELQALGADETTPLMALVIVTLPPGSGGAASANLRAPLVIDAAHRVARQIVLPDEALSLTANLAL